LNYIFRFVKSNFHHIINKSYLNQKVCRLRGKFWKRSLSKRLDGVKINFQKKTNSTIRTTTTSLPHISAALPIYLVYRGWRTIQLWKKKSVNFTWEQYRVGRSALFFSVNVFYYVRFYFYIHTSSITNIDLLYTKLTALNSSIRFWTLFCDIDFDLTKIGRNAIKRFQIFVMEGHSDILIFFFFFKMRKKF